MVQQSCGNDIPANIEKLKSNIRKCAEQGAQLVVLQELHNSVYFCQHEEAALCDLAEPIPGPSTETYGALAKELGIASLICCTVIAVDDRQFLAYITTYFSIHSSAVMPVSCFKSDDKYLFDTHNLSA